MVTLIVMLTIIGTVTLSFVISVRRIDSYYKRLSINIAKSYVAYVDADYMKELKEYVASEEFQKIRVEAEEKDEDNIFAENDMYIVISYNVQFNIKDVKYNTKKQYV